MSEGLKTLLEAAQFIEQQEKLKLSPQATSIPAILNEQQSFIMHAYDATIATSVNITNPTTTTTNNGHLNGGSINIRNSSIRHGNINLVQVSSSAPAASASFQHVNGHHVHHHNNNNNNNSSSCSSNTTASTMHSTSHLTTKVLTNGTNNASASSATNSHQQHLNQCLQHPNLNHNRHQHNSQLLNEFNGNVSGTGSGSGSAAVVATSSSTAPPTTGNLLKQSSLSGSRPSEDHTMDGTNSQNSSNESSNSSFMLLTNSTTTKLLQTSLSSPIPMSTDEEPDDDITLKCESGAEKTIDGGRTATFTLIGRNGEIIGNAAASKEMLLANGIRIATPSVAIGQIQKQPQQVALSKTIGVPHNNKNVSVITGMPHHLTTSVTPSLSQQQQLQHNGGGGVGGSASNSIVFTSRHKTFIPLTPPPMSSRKFVEPTQSRIRSFSLSSHKFSANNHHQLHVQNGNNNNNHNNNNSMMVDEIPPTQQSHHSPSSQLSPSRHVSSSLGTTAGSHYMHMINAATSQQGGLAGSGANHITHTMPRRRTISSTSNGAGTREVHNKLEKNRRAHLKECYEALKNQLSLKDEDRRKTSNLAILGEALKSVQSFQKRNQELETEWELLANDKINLQKRIVSLKRELGPKYEQIFSGIFPEIEIGSIPSERETTNETHSLSSGRGSTLYSSSSSLSSGGSIGSNSGSNTMSSPVGAGLQTALPTTISPVINKISNNINSTSPISINSNSNVVIQQQQQQQRKTPSITTTIQAVSIPAQSGGGAGGVISPPAGSPTALVSFGSSLPLSLTAKNISATAVTRGSPTPSTPSPSPSSSSGVSSSSSLISSSPPINGVISNGRNVTVNIPTCLKLQAAAVTSAGLNCGGSSALGGNGTTTSTATTILSTSAPAQGVTNTNNVLGNQQQAQQQHQHNGRKKNLTMSNNCNNNNKNNNVLESKNSHQHASEDGEQPTKFLKVFNSSTALINGHNQHFQHESKAHHGQKVLVTSNGGILQGGGCGGISNNNANNIGSSIKTATAGAINKSLTTNGSTAAYAITSATLTSANELCRLPGGAELNILPSNGLKIPSGGSVGQMATAFYHANGKITFLNGPPANHQPHQYQYQQHPPSSPLPNSTTISSNGTTTLTNGILLKDATGVTPLLVSAGSAPTASNVNGLHFAGNFAQLLAAANVTTATNSTGSSSNGTATAATATASIVPMATNFQNIVESKAKNTNKTPIITWRSGATAN